MAIKAAVDETDPLLAKHNGTISKSTSQLALVGSRVCPIESLDFEIAENELLNQDLCARNDRVEFFGYLILKWALCFIIGVFSGCVGFFFNLAIENIAGVKFVVTSNMMLASRYKKVSLGIWSICSFKSGSDDVCCDHHRIHCAGGCWIGDTGGEGLFEWH